MLHVGKEKKRKSSWLGARGKQEEKWPAGREGKEASRSRGLEGKETAGLGLCRLLARRMLLGLTAWATGSAPLGLLGPEIKRQKEKHRQ